MSGHPGHIRFDSVAQFVIHLNHLQKLDQPLRTCLCKACKKAPLTSHTLIRLQEEPASIITPADEASAENRGEEEEDDGEDGDEYGDEDVDEDTDEDKERERKTRERKTRRKTKRDRRKRAWPHYSKPRA